ncbi:hypothetical protein WG66_014260 [Moniliophthora roreri]|nr:hypothetical protein WG66_014260 [Moniliophthora roreri]
MLWNTGNDEPSDFWKLLLLRKNYTRHAPPIPDDMKDEICVWGFEFTESALGSNPPGSLEEFERCQFILQTCHEIGIGPAKAQITFGQNVFSVGLNIFLIVLIYGRPLCHLRRRLKN